MCIVCVEIHLTILLNVLDRVPPQKLFDPTGEDPDEQVGVLQANAHVQLRVESLTLHVEHLPFKVYSGKPRSWQLVDGEEG